METGLDRWHTNCLKSAYQKYIRRGDCRKAKAVAAACLRKSPDSLLRRLPFVVCEDGGPAQTWVGGTLPFECGRFASPRLFDSVMRATCVLAREPKYKDCAALCDLILIPDSEESVYTWLPYDKKGFLRAIEAKDAYTAARYACHAVSHPWGSGVWDVLRDYVDPVAFGYLRGRATMKGATKTHYLVSLCVLMACDGSKPVMPTDLESIDVSVDPSVTTLDWFCADMHTFFGKAVLSAVAKQYGVDLVRIRVMWWWFESALCDKYAPTRWYDYGAEAFKVYGLTLEEARKEWDERWSREIQARVLAMLARRGFDH